MARQRIPFNDLSPLNRSFGLSLSQDRSLVIERLDRGSIALDGQVIYWPLPKFLKWTGHMTRRPLISSRATLTGPGFGVAAAPRGRWGGDGGWSPGQFRPIRPLFRPIRSLPGHHAGAVGHAGVPRPLSGPRGVRGIRPRGDPAAGLPALYPLPPEPSAFFCRSRSVHRMVRTWRMRRAPSRRFAPKYPRAASKSIVTNFFSPMASPSRK